MFPKAVPDLREGPGLLSHSLKPRPLQCLIGMIASRDPVYISIIGRTEMARLQVLGKGSGSHGEVLRWIIRATL